MNNQIKIIEDLILKSKTLGYISPSDIYEGYKLSSTEIHDIVASVLHNEAKSKLISYGIIEKEKTNGVYPLTQRGRHFESFEKEDKIEKQEAYMKKNAYLRARYWWLIMIGGAVLGWILKIVESRL
jgi:hypothetical protein